MNFSHTFQGRGRTLSYCSRFWLRAEKTVGSLDGSTDTMAKKACAFYRTDTVDRLIDCATDNAICWLGTQLISWVV